jgi:hypothetical protein
VVGGATFASVIVEGLPQAFTLDADVLGPIEKIDMPEAGGTWDGKNDWPAILPITR